MNIDIEAAFSGRIRYADMVRDLRPNDLVALTDEALDALAAPLVTGTTDELALFVPSDPAAEEGVGWTAGHIIAHATATLEEAAALAAMMARGIPVEIRLRYEVPWQSLNTIARIQARLQESRRMCQAFLAAWPDEPHLDIQVTRIPALGPMNAIGLQALGIGHAISHATQLKEVARQYAEGRRA